MVDDPTKSFFRTERIANPRSGLPAAGHAGQHNIRTQVYFSKSCQTMVATLLRPTEPHSDEINAKLLESRSGEKIIA
jgi:hypothetical protein